MSVVDISTCLSCDKVISSGDSIKCDKCRKYLHGHCTGLSRTVVAAVLEKDSHLRFVCKACLSVNEGVGSVGEILNAIKVQFNELKNEIAELRNLMNPDDNARPSCVEDIIEEIRERDIRSSNVIMYGIGELDSNSSRDRINHDKTCASKVCADIAGGDVSTSNIKVYRLGRVSGDRPRPLKVILDSATDARRILASSHKLPRGGAVSVGSDRTMAEREYLTQLRGQLKSRIEGGESDLTIKYNFGRPKIVKSGKAKNDIKDGVNL